MKGHPLATDARRVLLLEGINDSAVELLRAAGYVDLVRMKTALDGAALLEAVR